MQDLFKTLSERQIMAVKHIDGPMLILAGAGSGKTKTITTRLAYLIGDVGIDPLNTLTLTFTNKAANTMRQRAISMLSSDIRSMPLLCTFHKFGLLFLKFHINELDRKNNFTIIDTEDKKKIIKNMGIDLPSSIISNEISKYKNLLLSVDNVLNASIPVLKAKYGNDENYEKIANAYMFYEKYLQANNLVDFDDLLILTYKILKNNEALADKISEKYQYIMVDEYQDTNDLQYKLLRQLCKTHQNLVVVGDNDQSIYSWRGSKVENILNFKDQFKDVKIIKLEHNYRSAPAILNAANELIEHNISRISKVLISTKNIKNEVEILQSDNEKEEAALIARKIKKLLLSGVKASEIAILYRINALSRGLEDGLNKAQIPFKMVGSIKFYERTEIKDIISYLRLILNPHDDFSLRRIINRPKRGLGDTSVLKLEKFADERQISLFQAIQEIDGDLIGKKARAALLKFASSLNELKNKPVDTLLDELDETFGIKEYFGSLPDGFERVANIDELYGLLKDQINNSNFSIDEFLNEIALQSEQDAISDDAICIMSVHASKGLEFEHVFIIGLEEGFFPLTSDTSVIEEERRLAYVAITRAKTGLSLSYSKSRLYKGKRAIELVKSRFLSEAGLCKGSLILDKNNTEFKKGELIKHKIFGIGRIIEVTKENSTFKLTINFGGITKKIMSDFVQKVE